MKKKLPVLTALLVYTFYYLVIELLINDRAETVIGPDNVVLLYGIFCIFSALGFVLFYFLRRVFQAITTRRWIFIAMFVLNAAGTILVPLTNLPALFCAVAAVTMLMAGYIGGTLYYAITMSLWGEKSLGKLFAIFYSAAFLLQFIVQSMLPFFGGAAEAVYYTLIIAALGYSAYVVVLRLSIRYTFTDAAPAPAKESDADSGDLRQYLWGTVLCCFIMWGLFGLGDGMVTMLHAGQQVNIIGLTSLIPLVSWPIAGWIFDFKDRRFFSFAVLIAMIMLVIGIFTFNSADTFNYSLAFLYIAGAFTTLYSTVVFFDIAPATKQPDLWAVIGRAANKASTGIFSILGVYVFKHWSLMAYSITYVVLLIVLLSMFYFQGHLSVQRAEPSPVAVLLPDVQRLRLTEREAEVFEIALEGLTISEIAKRLFISEVTVKRHVGSILKKANLKDRAALIGRYGKKR